VGQRQTCPKKTGVQCPSRKQGKTSFGEAAEKAEGEKAAKGLVRRQDEDIGPRHANIRTRPGKSKDGDKNSPYAKKHLKNDTDGPEKFERGNVPNVEVGSREGQNGPTRDKRGRPNDVQAGAKENARPGRGKGQKETQKIKKGGNTGRGGRSTAW